MADDPFAEWQGMPEFVQPKQKPFRELKVRFASQKDVDDFARRMGQKITPLTKSLWHPQLVRGLNSGLRYVQSEFDA